MAEDPTGKFGYVNLVTTDDHRVEYECFVVSQDDRWSVVMVPYTEEVGASDGSWPPSSASVGAAEAEADGPVLKVPESATVVELKKVEAGTVCGVPQTKAVSRRFTPRPSSSVWLSLFYQSEYGRGETQSAMKASSTDAGGRSARQLEAEFRRLSKELASLKEERQGAQNGPARSPSKRGQRHQAGHVASEVDGEGAERPCDYSDGRQGARDPIARLVRGRRYLDLDDVETTKSAVPPLPQGPGAPMERTERCRRNEAGGRDGELARGSQERRAGSADAARQRVRPHETAGLEIQLEMVKLLKELRDGGGARGVAGDDAPGAQELDGLWVMRNLGRMRALRERMEHEPDLIYSEYRKHWLKELGAEGRAFKWTDSHKQVRWKKFASVKRMDWMLCHLLETLDVGDAALARAQTVQCLKALREFSNFGSWRAAWPLTHMTDPLRRYTHGGLEAETEVVLGWLRTTDDLEARVLKSSRRIVEQDSEGEGEDAEGEKAVDRGKKKPVKDPKGGGRGKADRDH